MICHGTFHANVFGTIHREATDYLFRKMERKGMYGFVGKVNMDCNSRSFLLRQQKDSLRETRNLSGQSYRQQESQTDSCTAFCTDMQ